MPSESNPTVIEAPAIDDVFETTVKGIREAATRLMATSTDAGSGFKIGVDVIDLELNFKSVAVTGSSGFAKLVSSDKQTTSTLEVRLATRIRLDPIEKIK
jgi:hypothetical protein